MAYSEDLRKKVIDHLSEGHTQVSTAQVFKIGLSTVKEWQRLYAETGSLAKRPLNRSFKKLDPVKLTAYVKEHPDAYLREIGDAFGCTDDAVRLALIKLGITRKKRRRYTKNGMNKDGVSS
jgi:transposase